ncbi:hypothetical protein T265_00673 [Opisthorchis viverrini]|uniref:Uncharacterized protein n=1 Tax=Opisthorchis viverrini TaxID=6198 RepID=A0A075ACF8_OPIVI|nr:hypothetical protein T265_00673 [Opisthorchis viverrini]KER33575.1 hypothetical protein T265_00673 [Opisthorchis viverrini]
MAQHDALAIAIDLINQRTVIVSHPEDLPPACIVRTITDDGKDETQYVVELMLRKQEKAADRELMKLKSGRSTD